MFLVLIELICGVLVLWGVISQIIYPAYRGTPMFPFFRTERKLQEELSETNQDIEEAKIKADIQKAKEFKNVVFPEDKKEDKKA
jgi:Tfp pilus assembly protein PilE